MRITLNENDFIEYREGKAGTLEIFDIAVNSERGKGIGRELVSKLPPTHTLYGFTREENHRARAFYKALGFREIFLEGFYEDGNAYMVIK